MAQNENYSQVDLRVGTEEQFNAKVGTLPAGTLFGTTDSTVSKADLSTDLKNEINGKINKPANPTSDSAVVINSSGTVSTKPLSDIAGKSEVAVSSTTPLNDEILWINPDGTSGGGSSGGGKLYRHQLALGYRITSTNIGTLFITLYNSNNIEITTSILLNMNISAIPAAYSFNAPPKTCVIIVSTNQIQLYTDTQLSISEDSIINMNDTVTEV